MLWCRAAVGLLVGSVVSQQTWICCRVEKQDRSDLDKLQIGESKVTMGKGAEGRRRKAWRRARIRSLRTERVSDSRESELNSSQPRWLLRCSGSHVWFSIQCFLCPHFSVRKPPFLAVYEIYIGHESERLPPKQEFQFATGTRDRKQQFGSWSSASASAGYRTFVYLTIPHTATWWQNR